MKQFIYIIIYDLIFMGLGILIWKVFNYIGKYMEGIGRKMKDSKSYH